MSQKLESWRLRHMKLIKKQIYECIKCIVGSNAYGKRKVDVSKNEDDNFCLYCTDSDNLEHAIKFNHVKDQRNY